MHRSRTLTGIMFGALLAPGLAASACSASTTSPSPTLAASANTSASLATGLAITGRMTLSARGETESLAAVVMFADGSAQDRTTASNWSSSNEAVATVSSAGIVMAKTDGRTTITATFGNLTAS